jgi:glycosyltransferase involved in cell wall biosynthesis
VVLDELVRVEDVASDLAAEAGVEHLAALGGELGHTVELHVVTSAELPPREGIVKHTVVPGGAEAAELFRRADLVCLPSHVDAVPWTVLEALASGVPLVATLGSAVEEIVGDAALLVPPHDTDALHAALARVIGDDALGTRLRRAGPERAAKFTWERSVEGHLDAYERAIAARASA